VCSSDLISDIKRICADKKVGISSLGFYSNALDSDIEKREAAIRHVYGLIDASEKLGVNMITTFIGRDQTKTVEDNLKTVGQVWSPIVEYAEKRRVRIAIENCPMLFGPEQWPGGQILFTTPVLWRKIFEIINSDYLGINYDPSHFIWQMIDYTAPIYEFSGKLFHVHIKDIKLYPEKLKQCGTMAYPLEYMSPKIPGHGDVDWGGFISALTDIGYNGSLCLEIEDKAFEGSEQDILNSLTLSKRYINQFIV
jgi:sugar phosphate isomerase/epimerase